MKVEQKKEFKPITIILETPEEAEMMMSLVGNIFGGGKVRDFTSCIYDALDKLGVATVPHFTGELRTK